jgi:3-methylfumaryl-CoA hydratase
MLAGHAQDLAGKRLRQFRYRGLRPSLVGNALTVNATPDDHGLILWIALPDGAVSMRAEATF